MGLELYSNIVNYLLKQIKLRNFYSRSQGASKSAKNFKAFLTTNHYSIGNLNWKWTLSPFLHWWESCAKWIDHSLNVIVLLWYDLLLLLLYLSQGSLDCLVRQRPYKVRSKQSGFQGKARPIQISSEADSEQRWLQTTFQEYELSIVDPFFKHVP